MVVCLIVEALTLGLTTIWFAGGAFVAMILSFLGVPIGIQIAAFLVISIACLFFIYPIVKNKIRPGKEKTNYEKVIDKIGVVTETIDNMNAHGQVKVDGQIWSARTTDGGVVEVGNMVMIQEVIGVKLIVKGI
jgi:membrane protein implicated in regulation of membrane protease activity